MASRSVFEYPEMWARSGAGLRASCCAARGAAVGGWRPVQRSKPSGMDPPVNLATGTGTRVKQSLNRVYIRVTSYDAVPHAMCASVRTVQYSTHTLQPSSVRYVNNKLKHGPTLINRPH
jgi:hypothetical protein